MLTAIKNELIMRRNELLDETFDTIYFGGGTPSLLTQSELEEIIACVKKQYNLNSSLEVTLETNPDDITAGSLQSWYDVGINRLSVGIQSFREKDLQWMNRAHSMDDSKNCLKLIAESAFENVSVDLIYGLPNLNSQELRQELKKYTIPIVKHISAYCLTVESKTSLHHLVKKGELVPSSNEGQASQFELLVHDLKKEGFSQYEISNFAKDGYESKHNSSYWQGKPYIGIGPSAHSFSGNKRRWNVSNNTQYMSGVEQGKLNYESENLSSKELFNEHVLTGLRTSLGIDLEKLSAIHEISANFKLSLSNFAKNEDLEITGNTVRLSDKGKLIADHIASSLFII